MSGALPPTVRAKRLVWTCLRTAYHWAPLPETVRSRLTESFYSHFRLEFSTTAPASPFGQAYAWDYLKPENSDRPTILESIVGPYIGEQEAVFDVCCGFSPLSRFLLERKCSVVGFDISAEAIDYCTRAYPAGRYHVANDDTVGIPGHVDVLIHLGISPGRDPWGLESRTEVNTSSRAIRQTLPRVIILETAVDHSAGYDALKSFVEGLSAYRLEKELVYEFHLNAPSINPVAALNCKRVLSILRKEGPFNSLSEQTLARLLTVANPTAQAESFGDLNLGFGFLYYAMGRIVRPQLALVLGSQKGFSALCIALAIRDNADGGKLILVDAGYDDVADGVRRGHGGIGFWRDPENVARLLSQFGVADVMQVEVMLTSEFAALYTARKMPPVDLLLIDADHSYQGFKCDFETYGNFVREDGVILCHDTEVEEGFLSRSFGVGEYVKNVVWPRRDYQAISLPVWPGLGIIRKIGSVRGAPPPISPA